ncbi:MAG: hypothetical protein AAB453_00400 [Patescibacteria group bacterium]
MYTQEEISERALILGDFERDKIVAERVLRNITSDCNHCLQQLRVMIKDSEHLDPVWDFVRLRFGQSDWEEKRGLLQNLEIRLAANVGKMVYVTKMVQTSSRSHHSPEARDFTKRLYAGIVTGNNFVFSRWGGHVCISLPTQRYIHIPHFDFIIVEEKGSQVLCGEMDGATKFHDGPYLLDLGKGTEIYFEGEPELADFLSPVAQNKIRQMLGLEENRESQVI